MDDTVARVATLGPGALLAKMDIHQAYRNIPVALEDKHLLGLQWHNQVYVDQVLSFGLRSAPLIFSAIADAHWHNEFYSRDSYNTKSKGNRLDE